MTSAGLPSEAGSGATTRTSLADEYLQQACEALRASGSAETLYPENVRLSDTALMKASGRAIAPGKRVGFSRTAILFAALASEAFINEFLDEHLGGADLEAVDKLPTFEKYILGPQLAVSTPLFDRARQPAQTLRELIRLRDRLVHSKPREVPARGSAFDDPDDFEKYNPEAASRFIVAVADAAVELAQHRATSLRNFTVLTISQAPQVILDFGARASSGLPEPTDAAEEDLVMQAVTRLTGRSRDYTTPRD
jgi:hypothetical protein